MVGLSLIFKAKTRQVYIKKYQPGNTPVRALPVGWEVNAKIQTVFSHKDSTKRIFNDLNCRIRDPKNAVILVH